MSAHEDYLQTNVFLDTARLDSWDVDISFYQAVLAAELHRMSCGNNARVEGLDVTLDDPAGCTRTDPSEWSDVSA